MPWLMGRTAAFSTMAGHHRLCLSGTLLLIFSLISSLGQRTWVKLPPNHLFFLIPAYE
jgi:hypothetical protein